ncbi:MAG TPA: hypothetical protein VJ577_01845 [Burkholderiaceae bacterium]|nr:hypothetical protein [Burkholderiaceae bacterium]
MEPYLVWGAMIIVGAIFGLFFRPKVSGLIIISLFGIIIAGTVVAVFLGWLRQEILLLAMGVVPAGLIIFGAAVTSNMLLHVIKRSADSHRSHE